MPEPAGWKSTSCSFAKASMARYFFWFDSSWFWMSWSSANTNCWGVRNFFSPMPLNLLMTADVLSCVITRWGRMERKSPVRSGRDGPSAMWVWAIFSTMVWAMRISVPEGHDHEPRKHRRQHLCRRAKLADFLRCIASHLRFLVFALDFSLAFADVDFF